MLWPQRPDTWRYGAKPAQQAFVDVAQAIAESETVFVGVNDEQYENARNQLPAHIRVVELSSNDAWMRDVGPTFITHPDGRLAMVDWEFNAWGGLKEGSISHGTKTSGFVVKSVRCWVFNASRPRSY